MAQYKVIIGASSKVTCEAKGSAVWRDVSGISFDAESDCKSDNKPFLTVGERPDGGNPDTGLARAAVTAVLKSGFTEVWPARSSLPKCGQLVILREWLKKATNIDRNAICTEPPKVTGLSFTEDMTAKLDLGGTICAHNCPDPDKSVLLSGTFGLDKYALTGTFRIGDLTLQEQFAVPLGFVGYRNAECIETKFPCCYCEDESGEEIPGKVNPDTGECLCPCYCDPPDNTVKSVKKPNGECECELCQDDKTLKRKYLEPECYCTCADGTEKEMKLDGSCPCDCTCEDGSYDTIDESGQCPCFCECKDCTNSTLGPSGCICDDICPPCELDEKQVWENCECQCKSNEDCGIPPTCVVGRKGPMCDEPDCLPCQGCSGNGVCNANSGGCSSSCRCNRGWGGECCDVQLPRRNWGDPHLETLDGKPYDYFGIGEFVFCQSRDNDFGVHSRFFYYNNASLIGAVAVKAENNVVTITTPGTAIEDLPCLRIDGDLAEVKDKYTLGNSTVILDIQQPVANDTSDDGVAVAILSFQFKLGTSFTVEVRHSSVMHRQYMNIMFTPSVSFQEKTEGLCGFMDNDDTNDFQGPDGVTYVDPIDFADSWRISTSQLNPGLQGSWSYNESNFHVNDTMDKSYTDPTYVPIYSIDHLPEEQRKVAEETCIALGLEGPLLDGCIYDVAVTNDTSLSEQESLKTGCPSQCSGKGRCVNSTCECLEGWSGDDCRLGACGVCTHGSCEAGFCRCDIGWEGPICDVKATCLGVNNCTDPSQGQCLMTDICLCTPGYTGSNCSVIATCYEQLNCSNQGLCIDFDECVCDYGWKGDACDVPSCETHSYCSGNGDCVDYDECNCFIGWKGPSCGIPDCTAMADCSRNGECIAPDTCDCYSGYVGSNCSLPLNCSHLDDCNGNGMCVFDEGAEDLICRCYLGYDGINCSSLECGEVNDCSGHGTCAEPNLCECYSGYTGSECSVFSCESLGFCSGHGSCVEYDVCHCTEGWIGISCSTPTCHNVSNCTDQGVCIALNVCECYDGYDGIACDEVSLPNEVAPEFLQSDYNTTIPEHTPSGSIILTVEANDTDVGRSGEITYSLAFGTEFFTMSSNTGEISTQIEFDYESVLLPNRFDLIAIAEDDGRPVLSSTVTVVVFISDLNDNCPELYDGEAITNVDLPPDAPIGTTVHQIFAEDADSSLNGELVYSFFQAPETITSLFAVSDSGIIYTIAFVPVGMHNLKISVSDQGEPPCSLLIQVNVDVIAATTVSPTTTASQSTTKFDTTQAPVTTLPESPVITTLKETTNAPTVTTGQPMSSSMVTTPPMLTSNGRTHAPSTTPPESSAFTTVRETTKAQTVTTERLMTSSMETTHPILTSKGPVTDKEPSTLTMETTHQISTSQGTSKSPSSPTVTDKESTTLTMRTTHQISTSQSRQTTTYETSTKPLTEPKITTKQTTEPIVTTKPTTEPVVTTKSTTEAKVTTKPTTEPIVTTNPTTERVVTTEPKTATKPKTEAKTVSPKPTDDEVCSTDEDCNGNGLCTDGECQCSSCIYTGRTCGTVAQCFECSMAIDELYGQPAEYSDALDDPESDEYKKATETLYPFIEGVIQDTETAAVAFLFAKIVLFKQGSIKVDYTVTLEESAMVSAKQLQNEMNEALLLHQDDPNVLVRNGSLSVSEHRVPITPSDPLNMVIFTYVGCAVAILGALVVATYLPNRGLLKSHGNKLLLTFCVSLVGLYASYIVLIAFMDVGQVNTQVCKVVAGVVHYFVLLTAAWTLVESIHLCLNFNNKRDGLEAAFISVASTFAIGIPAAIVVTTIVITKQEYILEDICFLKQVPMIASLLVPLAVVVSLNIILYIYATTTCLRRTLSGDKISRYESSKTRLGNDVIVLVLLILNWIFGYMALIPSTSYIAQPFFCFLAAIFGFVLIFLYVIRKPFTHPIAFNDNVKSTKSKPRDKSEKQIDKYADEQPVFHISKTRDSRQQENEYVDLNDGRPPLHVEEWYKHSKRLTGYHIPRARVSSCHSSSSGRSSSAVSNGRRSAYFNPDSVPMSPIERNRITNNDYRVEKFNEEYNFENDGFEQDYF